MADAIPFTNIRHREGEIMQDAGWKKLCREIMNEREPVKLFALADALSRGLDTSYLKIDEPEEIAGNIALC